MTGLVETHEWKLPNPPETKEISLSSNIEEGSINVKYLRILRTAKRDSLCETEDSYKTNVTAHIVKRIKIHHGFVLFLRHASF